MLEIQQNIKNMQFSLNSLKNKIWEHRAQFFRYFVVGGTAFMLDMSSLYFIKEHFGLQPVQAVVINQVFILAYVFSLNKKWSFGATGATKRQLMKFLGLASFNYLVSVGWMWLFTQVFSIHYLIARVANIILAVTWNFLLYKYWVYKAEPVHRQPEIAS